MMSTTGIANLALQKVGAASILNLSDATPEAREISRAYDYCRRAELRAHRWNFALSRAVLAPSTVTPGFGYAYAFPLPTDCLRVLLPNDPTLDWKVEGASILTNSATSPFDAGTYGAAVTPSPALYLKYIRDVTDPTQFDPCFIDAFAVRVALAVVERLTQSNPKKQLLQADYKVAIAEASRANAFEKLPADPPDDDFWLARVR